MYGLPQQSLRFLLLRSASVNVIGHLLVQGRPVGGEPAWGVRP